MASVKKQVRDILKGQYIKDIVHVDVVEKDELPDLSYRVDQEELNRIFTEKLGKTILFTDNDGWTTEQIVLAYRGQAGVEDCFKTMKNPHFVSWAPMFHWSDHNVRVHAFYCVIALTLVSLLQRELHNSGMTLSITSMLDELSKIREVAITYDGIRKKPTLALSKRTHIQNKLFDVLKLNRYLEV